MTRRDASRNRERPHRRGSSGLAGYSLQDAVIRTGLSERWVRKLIKRHGLNVRTVPCAGGYRFVFSRDDLQQIERIHVRNQEELRRRAPALYAVVGKMRPFTTPVNNEREILRDRRM